MTGKEIIAPPLTNVEQIRLASLEAVIKKNLKAFLLVGEALTEIRDSKLYRTEFATFEDYFRKVWDIGKSRAYQLMDSAEVMKNLSTIVDKGADLILPENEAQTRPLAGLEPKGQIEVMKRVTNVVRSGGEPFTARLVQRFVSHYLYDQVLEKINNTHGELEKEIKENGSMISEDVDKSFRSFLKAIETEFKNGLPSRAKRIAIADCVRSVIIVLEG